MDDDEEFGLNNFVAMVRSNLDYDNIIYEEQQNVKTGEQQFIIYSRNGSVCISISRFNSDK